MRYAEGLHPVWGFLAPPKRFTRTIRIVIIAAVLGATAGSFSLIEHSRDETSVAARTLVTQQPPSTLLSAQGNRKASSKASQPSQLCRPCVLTPPTGARSKEGEQEAPSWTALRVAWTPVQFSEGWLVPCCRALAPLATNLAYLLAIDGRASLHRKALFLNRFVRRNILWYSPYHPLRRQQT